MTKFFAVVKREYLQRVRTKMFIIMTILGPILLAVFTVVPGMLLTIKTSTTRLALIDQTEGNKLYKPIYDALLRRDKAKIAKPDIGESVNSNTKERMEGAGSITGSFSVEQVNLNGRPLNEVRRELNERIGRGEIEGYLVIPPDILKGGASKAEYYGRNVGDVMTRGQIEQRLNRAVTRQRLIENNVKEDQIDKLSTPVALEAYPVNEKGVEGAKDSGAGFIAVFVITFLIYLTILLYGQVVLGAIVEEKETRIAEILFSSVGSFTLMFGKLIGVSLVALTQLGIWLAAFVALSGTGIGLAKAQGLGDVNLPHLPASTFIYFFLFFILGYFIYSTIYALVGSMVTTTQEGGQVALPVIFLLMIGFYLSFPVIRSPNSPLAFWVSMVPFFSPITMMVRIVSQTPPVWQVALSLLIGLVTVVLLLWIAARVYRIGMLMYGKKASIPEVWRWVRQT
jgi:ABC-2 type transport system permease protein